MKQKNRYISGIMYMVSFMLPCICWPEAFMLIWVDRSMVMTDSSGSTISRDRPICGMRVRSMPRKFMCWPNSVMVAICSTLKQPSTPLLPASTSAMMLVSRVMAVKEMPAAVIASPALASAAALMWKMRSSGLYTTPITPNMTRKFSSMGTQPAVGL